jgi:hypothetical protein
MTSVKLATPESYPRIDLADRLLGDRIAIRSAALSNLTGSEYDQVSLERSTIAHIRKNLYLVQSLAEIEVIIQQNNEALVQDNAKFK